MAEKTLYENAKVLLVDDNQINLYVLNILLEQFGIASDCVPSGAVCVKKALKKNYDLIFMDHMMPDMDGIETLKILKQNPDFNTPVVVLTANYGENLEAEYKAAGFAEYLMKPANADSVASILERYLGKGEQTVIKIDKHGDKDEKNVRDRLVEAGFSMIDELIDNGITAEEFVEMLDIFKSESQEKLKNCITFYEKLDLKNYSIIVHGLKNDAALIYDEALSEKARKHEIESKAGNERFVRNEWPQLRNMWEDTLNRIESFFKYMS